MNRAISRRTAGLDGYEEKKCMNHWQSIGFTFVDITNSKSQVTVLPFVRFFFRKTRNPDPLPADRRL
jgi:hypothetical protein